MPWFKVDDQLYSHPKWLATSPAARALWVSAGSWCAAHLTDGQVPRHVLSILGGRPRDAADLVRAGLWVTADDGWAFHGWLEMQPSAEQVEGERAAARDRQRRARERARESRRDATGTHGEVHPGVTVPPTRPDLGTTPQPPAERGASDATHDGQHPNCRPCGTNRRGPKPQPPERPLLPPNHAPEVIADLDHHPVPRIPDDAKATARQGLAEVHAALRRPRPTRESA